VNRARDLSSALGPVRDQGGRGTCLAFAVTAVHEQARRRRRGAWDESLGEEILYWACKQLDGDGTAGTSPSSVGYVLRLNGQSAGELWPYNGNREETSADYTPPAEAFDESRMRRATLRATSRGLDDLRARVDDGHAIVLGLEMWEGFFAAPGGVLAAPSAMDLIGEGHAVALVGYDDRAQSLLIRNSWGSSWGQYGHGWLSYDSLPVVLRGAWMLEDDLDP
jgi:Papain family cysteine protease